MATLFQVDPTISTIIPGTFQPAKKLATALLRSSDVQNHICSMFILNGIPHSYR
jgi:hypothetical protein